MIPGTERKPLRGGIQGRPRQGTGSMKFANGDRYEGQWIKDRIEGQGTYVYKNGNTYTGQWKNEMMNGRGEMVYAGREVYTGQWENDMRHGLRHPEKQRRSRFEGQWKYDLQVESLAASADPEAGKWESGTHSFIFESGDTYTGEVG